jgi:hypothetical protein
MLVTIGLAPLCQRTYRTGCTSGRQALSGIARKPERLRGVWGLRPQLGVPPLHPILSLVIIAIYSDNLSHSCKRHHYR